MFPIFLLNVYRSRIFSHCDDVLVRFCTVLSELVSWKRHIFWEDFAAFRRFNAWWMLGKSPCNSRLWSFLIIAAKWNFIMRKFFARLRSSPFLFSDELVEKKIWNWNGMDQFHICDWFVDCYGKKGVLTLAPLYDKSNFVQENFNSKWTCITHFSCEIRINSHAVIQLCLECWRQKEFLGW